MSKTIFELVDDLPERNITVLALRSLDTIIPGKWENLTGFENTIKVVTGETDQALIQQIGERAIRLFNDKKQGYQRALWLYQTIDSTGRALGTAAFAGKVGEKVKLLSFLDKITPKPEKAQTIDLALKLVTEIVAFCQINGIPGDSIGDFVKSLGDYSGESLMRMAALVSFDGLIPLGPNFILSAQNTLSRLNPKELNEHPGFKQIRELIPGNSADKQLGFINESFDSTKGWMGKFVQSNNLTPQKIASNLQNFVEVSEDKLDYLGAFLDMSTNYYEHTGIQTLARRLIERAVAEI
ncbi:MAG: hypothetical protein ACTS2F_18135 [Thainema sp.]